MLEKLKPGHQEVTANADHRITTTENPERFTYHINGEEFDFDAQTHSCMSKTRLVWVGRLQEAINGQQYIIFHTKLEDGRWCHEEKFYLFPNRESVHYGLFGYLTLY
jgi:hypothetical protein